MSKDFKDFVTAIGECKSKQEEDRIIMKEMCAPIPPLCVERFACEQRGGEMYHSFKRGAVDSTEKVASQDENAATKFNVFPTDRPKHMFFANFIGLF